MTCRYVRQHLGDLLDKGNDPANNSELRRHLLECAGCARDFGALERALAVPQLVRDMHASPDFKERTMSKLNEQLQLQNHSKHWMPVIALRFSLKLAIAAAVIAIVFALPYLGSVGNPGSSNAATLLAQSVQAMSHLESVHITARMRTLPRDNFELIGLKYDFVPIEMWKQFGATPRWRVEKPGRVVVMDGNETTLFIRPDRAARGGPNTGFVEWLLPLMDAERVLESELTAAKYKQVIATLSHDGPQRIVLSVNRKAQGNFSNDWLRNKSVLEADHTRIYSFDTATKRLTGLQVLVHNGASDVMVFEVTGIRYNEPVNAKLFTLDLPQDVAWYVAPESMPNTAQTALPGTPRDAALAFFEGMAEQNWDRVLTVIPESRISEQVKNIYGGLQVNSIGEPFQSGLYRGWFIPYQVRLSNGELKKHKLAVRNDNPAHRWVLDGGY